MTGRFTDIKVFLIAFFFLLFPPLQADSQIADLFSHGATIVQVHPGEKIQDIIDVAQPGTVILVSPGTYYESIKMKSNITLKSEKGAEETIIEGQSDDRAVVICADKSILDGFTITGRSSGKREEKKGIHAIECTNVSPIIRNCIIRDNESTGINVRGEKAAPLIVSNKIYKNVAGGIGCDEGSAARIVENEIYQNGLSGIGCEKGAHPLIEKNRLYENNLSGIGINGAGVTPTIRNNEIYRNRLAGIGIEDEAFATIEGNSIYKNNRAGIGIEFSAGASIIKNTISKNILAGICLKDQSKADIMDNEISFNVMAGVVVVDHSQIKFENNHVLENGTQGLIVTNSQATIRNNTVEDNLHHGIGLYADTNALVEQNTLRNNGNNKKRGAGIMVVGTDNALIKKNALLNNYGPGVQTRVCSPVITENYFLNNLLFVRNRSGPTIKHNTFFSYGKVGRDGNAGVNVRNHSFPLILENTFLGLFGVNVRGSSQAIIIGNIFSGSHKGSISSGRSGVKISTDSSPVILRNVFYNGNKILYKGRSIRDNVDPGRISKRVRRLRRRRKKKEFVIRDNLFL